MATKKVEIKIGKVYQVVSRKSWHCIPINAKVTINTRYSTSSTNGGSWYTKEYPAGGYVFGTDLIEVLVNKEDIKKDIKEKQEEINDLKLKLKFIEENGLEEYDENVFKSFKVLQLLSTSKSDIEKAKIIAELIHQ